MSFSFNNEQPDLHETAEELYEMAPCGYLTTAIDGRIIRINRTLTEWLGYKRDELMSGKRFVDLLTVGGRMFYETHFNLLLRVQMAVDEVALDMIRKDGRVLPTLINARQKRDSAGEPVLNSYTIFNATDRRMYERDLLVARDLFRTTLASIGDGVIATDADARVTFMNPVAGELSGWKDDAAIGKPIDEVLVLLGEDTGVRIENPLKHSLRTGVIVGLSDHTVLVSKDGRRIPVDDSASPIRDADGNVLGAVLVFRDISERRRAEKALRDAHAELERSAAELRRSNEDLSQFAHVASHDLRSPLNTVLQFAELVEREYGSQLGPGKELLTYVTSAGKRMARLIDDLLLYAHASTDASNPGTPVDVNVQLRLAIENLQAMIGETGATITYGALPTIPVSGTELLQIFQNLLGNAMHYRSADLPIIHIDAENRNAHWLFSCRDNGIGIAPEFQTQIFEPFKRLHGNDRPGSGIGLAVCKRIVERNRGRIWVESQVNQGSTFFFTLPKSP